MDRFTQKELHLDPRSREELRGVLSDFEQKWQNKVRNYRNDQRTLQL